MEKVQPTVGPSAQVVRIEGVPRGEGVCVVFAGPIVGLLTHWASGRSQACPGASKCNPTIHRGRTVWKGYAPARRWTTVHNVWAAVVLEITEALEEQLRGRDLTGEMWHLMRSAVSKKSAQVSGIFYSKRTEAQLSKTFDVIAPIQRLYHSTELEFGAVNALPAKVMVEPEICVGPDIGPEPVRREPALPTESQREALRKLAGRLGTGQPLNGTAKKLPTIQ